MLEVDLVGDGHSQRALLILSSDRHTARDIIIVVIVVIGGFSRCTILCRGCSPLHTLHGMNHGRATPTIPRYIVLNALRRSLSLLHELDFPCLLLSSRLDLRAEGREPHHGSHSRVWS